MGTNRTSTDTQIARLLENPREYLTYQQLAEILQTTERTIRRWADLDKIPRVKLGKTPQSPVRFVKSDIARWLQQHGA